MMNWLSACLSQQKLGNYQPNELQNISVQYKYRCNSIFLGFWCCGFGGIVVFNSVFTNNQWFEVLGYIFYIFLAIFLTQYLEFYPKKFIFNWNYFMHLILIRTNFVMIEGSAGYAATIQARVKVQMLVRGQCRPWDQ